jgi:hypothetical protein
MAPVSNTALRVTELDFDSIKENLKSYLQSQSEFQDYDFDGSGMSVLLDILAYNTHYMGYYLNMTGNEMFMDTAQLRSSILSHAKNINYIPTSAKGALASVNLTVTPSNSEDNVTTQIILSKYSKFLGSSLDGVNYNFVATQPRTSNKSAGQFNFANVAIKQGEVITLQYAMTPDNTKRRFKIPSANVDTETLEVKVVESSTNTDSMIYTLNTDVTDLRSNSTVYFVEENEDRTYTLYFGDDVLGKKPKNGNIIQLTYVDTKGSAANAISKFVAIDPIGGLYRDNVIVTTTQSAYGGAEKETIEQIRFRAPYAYTSQNRAVTKSDYETILTKDFPYIDYVTVWGGEENDPVVYGKVFLSIKTKDNFALTNIEKEAIKKHLTTNRNVVTVTPEIVDPDYAYIRVVAKVTYNPDLTTKTEGELSELVKAAIFDYNDTELSQFGAVFRKSKLQAYIEAADKSITGSEVTIYVQKRVILDLNAARKYDILYNMPIKKGTYKERLYSFPELIVADAEGVERNILFEEEFNLLTGIQSIGVVEAGSNYTTAPTVTISGDGTGATARAKVSAGRITSIEVTNAGTGYTVAEVSLSGGNGSGAVISPTLQIDYGVIRTFYYTSTGEKIAVNATAGTIDYTTGKLTLNVFRTDGPVENDFYGADELVVFAPAGSDIIQPVRNRILSINDGDTKSTSIDIVAEQ